MKYFVINSKAGRIILFVFFTLLVGFLLYSCDPPTVEFNLGGTFQIKAKILNQRDSLNLGDSLKVVFEIPDTIMLQNSVPFNSSVIGNSIILTEKISSTVGEQIWIADSNRAGGTTIPLAFGWCSIYANPGNFIRTELQLERQGTKLLAVYYVVPTIKGVFGLACVSTGGYFEGNSTSGKIKCRIVFDFDVADKHHYLLRAAIGQNNNLDPMIQQMASRGQGLYVFAVK